MVNGSNLAQQLLQYLVPRYDQSAKEYNNLTGRNTFVLIEKEPTGFEQFISTVYNNSLRPIGQMIVEDWNASLAANKARYIAFKTDSSLYNTANFLLGGIPDTVVSIYNGYELRNAALWQNHDTSSFLNWLTSGLSGQFEVVMTTPMSDPDYWRSTRNIVGTGVTVIIGYKGYSDWIISRNPHSTEWMMQYSDRMAGPAGQVPAGTFDEAFEKNPDEVIIDRKANYAFSNEIGLVLDKRAELTGTTREKLLTTTTNTELREIINQLYREGATVGDGGTAAILVEEFNNGMSTHLIKATERLTQLNRLISSRTLGLNDWDIAMALKEDLEYAIGLFD